MKIAVHVQIHELVMILFIINLQTLYKLISIQYNHRISSKTSDLFVLKFLVRSEHE